MKVTFDLRGLIKFTAVLFLASIAVLIFVIIKQPNDNYIKTTAVITDSAEEWVWDGERDTLRTTYFVDYTAAGQLFRHVEIGFSDADFEVGKEIEIFYNPEDPTDIRYDGKGMITYLIILAAVSFVITAGGFVLIRAKSKSY